MTPEKINAIALSIVANKASIGLADMADARVMEQAADIHAALLVVCEGIAPAAMAGDLVAVKKAQALKWFTDVCLDEAKPATVN